MMEYGFGHKERALLSVKAHAVPFALGEDPYEAHDRRSLFVITTGAVRTEKCIDDTWFPMEVLNRGSLFGHVGLFLGAEEEIYQDHMRYLAHSEVVIAAEVS